MYIIYSKHFHPCYLSPYPCHSHITPLSSQKILKVLPYLFVLLWGWTTTKFNWVCSNKHGWVIISKAYTNGQCLYHWEKKKTLPSLAITTHQQLLPPGEVGLHEYLSHLWWNVHKAHLGQALGKYLQPLNFMTVMAVPCHSWKAVFHSTLPYSSGSYILFSSSFSCSLWPRKTDTDIPFMAWDSTVIYS